MEVSQSCPTLCNSMDCSLPGSSVHRIFQARVLEWGAISFSRGSSQPRDRTQVSCTAGRCFTIWAFLKNHCSCTNLDSTNSAWRFFYPYPCQHLLFLVFLMVDILIAVRWYLIMFLHSPDDFWDLFCGLACDLSWRKFHIQNWNISKSVLILNIEVIPMFSPLNPTLCWIILQLNCFSSPLKGIY